MKHCFTRLFALILLVVLLAQAVPMTASAAGSVELIRPQTAQRFNQGDDGLWFPGDSMSRVYAVRTVHTKKTPLYFSVEVSADSALRKALYMTVYVAGAKAYEGPLSQFPGQLTHELAADETKTQYDIRFSLDTSVGNAYQNLKLKADFVWKYQSDDGDEVVLESPKTGDEFPLGILTAVMVSSGTLLICLLLLKRKKGEEK